MASFVLYSRVVLPFPQLQSNTCSLAAVRWICKLFFT